MSTLLNHEQLEGPAKASQAITTAVRYCMLACNALEEAGLDDGIAWQDLSAVIDSLRAQDAAISSEEAQRKAKAVVASSRQPLTIAGADGLRCLVIPKYSIRLVGVLENTYRCDKEVDRTYTIGDRAAYGGFNITYVGTIVSIGPKTVTIKEPHSSCKHRLTHYDFSFWNRNCTAQIEERNGEWYD